MTKKKIKIKDVLKTAGEGALGFATGGHLVSLFFEFKGKVAQERINKFSEQFLRCLEEVVGKEFDIENLKNEDFMDAFEIIARKAILTKSKEKLARYKNVLVKEVFEKNSESDSFSKYVNLIEDLNEVQILILDKMKNKAKYRSSSIRQLIEKIVEQELEHNSNPHFEVLNGEKITFEDFNFLLQELAGKGLLHRVISTKKGVFGEKETYELNTVGERFLRFIKEYDQKDV